MFIVCLSLSLVHSVSLSLSLSPSLLYCRLELLQVEVELGRFSLLREEVQEEEQAYQALQAQRGAARLQMEDAAVLGLQRKTQRLKACVCLTALSRATAPF